MSLVTVTERAQQALHIWRHAEREHVVLRFYQEMEGG